ncbi:hypothetical protein RQM47_09250 [Rubrivirga sp. S365]|uniref:Glycosyltransferase subfamily 4-like N-terminal domain-containing protein n=1 Tax=Rubrivirga litoralis TaxID=3075598 RepID=A0ABU3BSE0_9BACT|nr:MULTISPECIES: hypothetical protein [unclassified Rubrivirga]MDT0632215.1 hypothetical protein [Rubrivirga sp. F394]MDT7856825.1 hypothetical protein [Rubrivirga sp. S365]
MKRVLLISPHFPPSNLAAVHRARLFAQHLPAFGWEPIVLTVHHDDYTEELDWNLAELVPESVRVERVRADREPVRIGGRRLVGDVVLRSFRSLLRRAIEVVDAEPVDFVYVLIPSFYGALLGRAIHERRGVPYGIDYIDPWVEPNAYPLGSKMWTTQRLARVLEPVAVRDAALITGVAEGYYEAVLDRNPRLRRATTAAMPYGGEARDHREVEAMGIEPWLFERDGRFRLLYAGALLPQAVEPLHRVCRAIAARPDLFDDVELFFVGTGSSPDDAEGYQVRPVAEQYGLWGTVIKEHPARIPYLDVLAHLDATRGVFILGSTEPHYTPSKVYQGVLSERPVLAVLHQASTACDVIRGTGAGRVLAFDGEDGLDTIEDGFADAFADFRAFADTFRPADVDREAFEEFSARNVTRTLAEALDQAVA